MPNQLLDSKGAVMTEQQVRAALKENRMTIADWARARGFSVELSRMVLAGKRKCLRGQSREIAIALGLRAGLSDQG